MGDVDFEYQLGEWEWIERVGTLRGELLDVTGPLDALVLLGEALARRRPHLPVLLAGDLTRDGSSSPLPPVKSLRYTDGIDSTVRYCVELSDQETTRLGHGLVLWCHLDLDGVLLEQDGRRTALPLEPGLARDEESLVSWALPAADELLAWARLPPDGFSNPTSPATVHPAEDPTELEMRAASLLTPMVSDEIGLRRFVTMLRPRLNTRQLEAFVTLHSDAPYAPMHAHVRLAQLLG